MRNPWLCLTIVAFLGLGALAGTVGLILLAVYHIEPPQALVGTVAACWSALSTFLVQPPRGQVGIDAPQAAKPAPPGALAARVKVRDLTTEATP